jgi:hypothetical protein
MKRVVTLILVELLLRLRLIITIQGYVCFELWLTDEKGNRITNT